APGPVGPGPARTESVVGDVVRPWPWRLRRGSRDPSDPRGSRLAPLQTAGGRLRPDRVGGVGVEPGLGSASAADPAGCPGHAARGTLAPVAGSIPIRVDPFLRSPGRLRLPGLA